MASKRVAVFFGGRSNEREISVITGIYCCNLLRGAGYGVIPVYLPAEGGMATGELRAVEDVRKRKLLPVRLEGNKLVACKKRRVFPFDCALNCCHGGAGEDGTLAALLQWNGVKSASPALLPSALFMSKYAAKCFARGLGIPVAEGAKMEDGCGKTLPEGLKFPVIVKPDRLGSSIGISKAENEEELARALAVAFRLDGAALVEEYLPKRRDLNCAVYRAEGNIVLSCVEEVFSAGEILSFSEKYEGTGRRASRLPAEIGEELSERVRSYTRTLYGSLGCRGMMRADFLLDGEELYFNEMNTVPGSLALYLFGDTLTEAKQTLVRLVEEGMREEPSYEIVSTGILERGVFAGGKGGKRGA